MLNLSRRRFLSGLFAGPAIIAIDRLMPVKALITPPPDWLQYFQIRDWTPPAGTVRFVASFTNSYGATSAAEGVIDGVRLARGDNVALFTLPAGSTFDSLRLLPQPTGGASVWFDFTP